MKKVKTDSKYWAPQTGQRIVHRMEEYDGGWIKFGACGDKHMGSRHYRRDVCEALYDLYAKDGITTVFDTGNFIEGESRFNFNELEVHGLEDQIRNWAKNHPRREGITTYYIAGDDHEGWYQKAHRVEIGAWAEKIAREMGREDLRYLGYMEADIMLTTRSGRHCFMKSVHPGGGSAYAESYKMQKLAESYQEGEKPSVVLAGHYHKAGYGLHRGIHMFQTASCQDQTSFMRKIPTRSVLGGWKIELNLGKDGLVNRVRQEFYPFFNKSYYSNRFGQPGNVSPEVVMIAKGNKK